VHIIDPRCPLVANIGYLPRALSVAAHLARRRFAAADVDLLRNALGDRLAELALYDHAVERYRPGL
jgi:hypothetical protein